MKSNHENPFSATRELGSEPEGTKGALAGVTVIDLTRYLSGPFCTMILGDLGAEVVKIEQPGKGDDARAIGPFVNGESMYFVSVNRNKKSVELDLHSPEGRQVLKDLCRSADVLVESFRPGTMEKWGLDYETLKSENPRLIYASLTGFGQTGPMREAPAYDIVVQAMSGIMSITGQEGGPPTRVGASIGDLIPGLFLTIGIVSALYEREYSGLGQRLDIAMLDCLVTILENAIARYMSTGVAPGPIGNRHPSIAPFDTFQAKDGYLIIAAANDSLFARLCTAIGTDELMQDERFRDNPSRSKNQSDLKNLLEQVLGQKPVSHWINVLMSAGVPCAPVLSIPEVVKHPQVLARGMVLELIQPLAGKVKVSGSPIKLSRTPPKVQKRAPLLGEHTGEVLQRLQSTD
ncbi:MAG TPA: CoA transferase [Clostridia bacterium]|nr:CoA transferase [Clostridia bacterium]